LAAGADAFLSKPFRTDELLEEIRRLTGVEFLYDTARHLGMEPAEADSGCKTKYLDVSNWPCDLVAQMRSATVSADLEQLLVLIDQAAGYDPHASCVLRHLADRYEYEKLLGLIDNGGIL
jgi:hypothetical protein